MLEAGKGERGGCSSLWGVLNLFRVVEGSHSKREVLKLSLVRYLIRKHLSSEPCIL